MKRFAVLALVLYVMITAMTIHAQTTEITYQGQLQSSSMPASGSFDFEFVLFDGGGSQIGAILPRNGVPVANGVFSVNLDFGSGFPGATRFLEIRVRTAGGGAFTTLSPRQPVTSSPYSIKSLAADIAASATIAVNATNAANAQNAVTFSGTLNGDVTGTQSATTVARLRGRDVSATQPSNGQVLKFNTGTGQWEPAADETATAGGGGTITGVTAGTGLTGGGTTGNVSLSIANSGVTTAQIADNAITDPKIVSVSGAKVSGTVANATNATNSSQLGGVAASQYLQSNGNGSGLTNLNASSITTGTLANARLGQIPTANIADSAVTAPKIASGQVVKTLNGMTDSVTLAAGSNISITPAGNTLTIASTGGGGCPSPCTAAIFNATQQYNILGNRVLSTAGGDNLFAGDRAGQSNTTGEGNTFVGKDAGFSNISGNENSFFGARAGLFQSTGNQNAFFGIGTGANNAGNRNSAFGTSAGAFGNTGSDNSYFGAFSGTNNSGNFNTIIGASSDQAVNVSNATALGARAFVTQNNSLVLGSIAGVNGASTSVNVGIGTTAPQASLHVVGGGIVSQPGDARSVSIGIPNGESGISIRGTTNRADVRFDGDKLKLVTGLGTGPPASTNGITISTNGHVDISGDIDIGANGSTPDYGSRLQSNGAGVNRAIVGYNPSGNAVAGVSVAGEGVFGQSTSGIGVRGVAFNPGAAAIVANGTSWFAGNTTPLTVTSSTGLVIGSDPGSDSGFIQAIRYDGGQVAKTLSLNNLGGRVGIGTIAPTQTLDVNGRARIRDVPDTFLSFGSVCLNQASDLVRCGASSLKLKKNIRPYRSGLDVIGRLRPISYDSKEDGSSHIGLGAEDVAKVDPSLALSDPNGEIRGVKYERLNMLLINAVQEQQKIIENQQQQIDQLKRLTCRKNKKAAICKGTK